MLQSMTLVTTLLFLPALVQWTEKRSRLVRLVSPLIICYLIGIAVGNIPGLSLNQKILEASSKLFYFCGFVVFGSVLLNYLLAFLFRVDRDTMIITSTAAIYGPQFIGPVARAIGNREIIAVGITLGLIGYAVGNYLGLGIAFVLN